MTDSPDPWAAVTDGRRQFWQAVRRGLAVAVLSVLLLWITPWASGAIVVAWLVWLGTLASAIEDHRCPRCGDQLFRNGMYHNQFASRCLHCRQEIGAPVKRLLPHPGTPPT